MCRQLTIDQKDYVSTFPPPRSPVITGDRFVEVYVIMKYKNVYTALRICITLPSIYYTIVGNSYNKCF